MAIKALLSAKKKGRRLLLDPVGDDESEAVCDSQFSTMT
jgi:hypothetical protein